MKTVKNPLMRVLSIVLSIAMIVALCPAFSFAEEAPEATTLPIATLSDIHYYPECLAGKKGEAFYTYVEGSACIWDDLDSMLDASFESLKYQIENEGLKYIVLVGDLTTNGEYEGHVTLAEKLRAFRNETGCTIYLTNGNHDINNKNASTFVNDKKEQARMTTSAEFAEIYHDFGFDQAYHQFKSFDSCTKGSLSYSIKLPEGYRLIIADGGKYSADGTASGEDKAETAGAFSEEQLQWVLDEAADAKKDGEIPLLFTHWNMSGMNYFHEYLLQGFVIDDAYMLQETLADAGIHYSFSGHQHVSDLDITYSDSGEPMYSIITPTLTQYPFSYRYTTFNPQPDGDLDVTFDMCSIDEHSEVKTKDGALTYLTPYRNTGFNKQYSGKDGTAEFLWKIVKKMLDNYMGKIRSYGSIIDFIEGEYNIDLEEWFNSKIGGGINLGSLSVSGKNIMSFLEDLDSQLMQNYIYQKSKTYNLVKQTLIDVCEYQVSDVPCTKYIETYGFGNAEKGGTLGDFLAEALVYLYYGNEDPTDDAFILDILEQSQTTDFVDMIFNLAIEKIIEPLIIDEILANTELHLNTLFVNSDPSVIQYIQLAFNIIVMLADKLVFNTENKGDLYAILMSLGDGMFNITYKNIIETVLSSGYVSYGTTIDEVLHNVLNKFFDEANKDATAEQLFVLLDGIIHDEDKDWDVTYTYSGAIDVTPTVEDRQLPSELTITYGEDASGSFTVTWFTKYSVTGTDIEFTSSFNGATETKTEETTMTGFGFDFGSFGILPWTENAVKHSVKVTGLEPGTSYKFKVGDKEKGFMSEECSVKSAADGEKFSFIAVSDTAAVTAARGKKVADTLSSAAKTAPSASFILNAGNVVREPENDDRWSYVLDSCAEELRHLPMMAASGSEDTESFNKYLSYEYPYQMTDVGIFYSYNYGSTHFVMINPNNATKGGTLSAEQLKWLRSDLSKNDSDWTVLVINQPLYSSEDANASLRIQLLSYMNEYGVDLILQGGTAYYARTGVLVGENKDGNPVTSTVKYNGNTYLAYQDTEGRIALSPGGAGVKYESADFTDNNTEETDSSVDGRYSVVTVDGDTMYIDSYKVSESGYSSRIDGFAISRAGTSVLMGDVNLDGKVTVADARLALRYAVGLEKNLTDKQLFAASVFGDPDNMSITRTDTVTTANARFILRIAVKLDSAREEYVVISTEGLRRFAENLKK